MLYLIVCICIIRCYRFVSGRTPSDSEDEAPSGASPCGASEASSGGASGGESRAGEA